MASTELTTEQRYCAILDSQGHSRDEIGHVIGISAATIARWRGKEEYKQEVDRLRDAGLSQLHTALQKARLALIEGATKAVATLEEALTATDRDGNELWPVRRGAAVQLLEHGAPLLALEAQSGDGEGGGTAASAEVHLHLAPGERDPRRFDVEGEVTDQGQITPETGASSTERPPTVE